MVNRTRNKAVTLRMTDDEYQMFQSQFQDSQAKNQTDFVLRLLKDRPSTVNYEMLYILAELKRQGNNLNQIARQLNSRMPLCDEAKNVMQECWKTYKKILYLLRGK